MGLVMAELTAGLLIGALLFFLGAYVGLGIREDREADRHAKIALARIQAREAARPPVLYVFRQAPAPAAAVPFYRPGYADVFPRAGRFALGPAEPADQAPAPADQPHGPDSRPTTSPIDLDGAVRLMCIETELYVAALIAGTCHAERNEEQ